MSEYIVIFEEAEDGGRAACLPDLPGVVALGDARAEAEERIQEALRAYVEEMRSLGGEPPEPAHAVGTSRPDRQALGPSS